MMRELSKIHIFKEARHRGYAHEYLKRSWPQVGTFKRSMARRYGLLTTQIMIWQLIHPDIYKNLGLPPGSAGDGEKQPASGSDQARDVSGVGRIPDSDRHNRQESRPEMASRRLMA